MNIQQQIDRYLGYCEKQKLLSKNSMRAYRIDFSQFMLFLKDMKLAGIEAMQITKEPITEYISSLLSKYATQTCKRKIACLKAFFTYLEYEDFITVNPFRKIRVKFKEPSRLPKVMSQDEVQHILEDLYSTDRQKASSNVQFRALEETACIELLFSTGIRVGELCSLKNDSIDFQTATVRVIGKGNKERAIYIASNEALDALSRYNEVRCKIQPASDFFFVNQRLHRLSEDSIRLFFRRVISRNLRRRITPHMFRHTFASLLLANNVDLKVIQELLGHSSITTTQIYIHLTTGRLKDVLQCSHPRCSMKLQSNASIA